MGMAEEINAAEHMPQTIEGVLKSNEALRQLTKYAEQQERLWFVTWGESLIDLNAPRVPRTVRQRVTDWWEWRVVDGWADLRWRVADWLEDLANRVRNG